MMKDIFYFLAVMFVCFCFVLIIANQKVYVATESEAVVQLRCLNKMILGILENNEIRYEP